MRRVAEHVRGQSEKNRYRRISPDESYAGAGIRGQNPFMSLPCQEFRNCLIRLISERLRQMSIDAFRENWPAMKMAFF